MLLLADFLSVSPQLPAELKACLQPAAFALIDALTPFEVRVVVDVDGDTTISGCFGSAAWRFVVDWLIHGTDQSVHPPPTDPAHARRAARRGGAGAPQEAARGLPAAVQVQGAGLEGCVEGEWRAYGAGCTEGGGGWTACVQYLIGVCTYTSKPNRESKHTSNGELLCWALLFLCVVVSSFLSFSPPFHSFMLLRVLSSDEKETKRPRPSLLSLNQ